MKNKIGNLKGNRTMQEATKISYRYITDPENPTKKLTTVCEIMYDDIFKSNRVVKFTGYAICSTLDVFNKKIGRTVAYGRACKYAELFFEKSSTELLKYYEKMKVRPRISIRTPRNIRKMASRIHSKVEMETWEVDA